MGNICSSSSKKDKDSQSVKSEGSPSYTPSKRLNGSKDQAAPLADPEPTSDLSNLTAAAANANANANGHSAGAKTLPLDAAAQPPAKAKAVLQHSIASDSVASAGSPQTANAPIDLTQVKSALPAQLQSLHGVPAQSRRTERDRKIVLYMLAADESGPATDGGHRAERAVMRELAAEVQRVYAARGFEVLLCGVEDDEQNALDASQWQSAGPKEARGGHHVVAPCLAEIARHSKHSYFIPILFLGSTLGTPLLPLTIEYQDFRSILAAAQSSAAAPDEEREILQQWYTLDDAAVPQCYRLQTGADVAAAAKPEDLRRLLNVLVERSTREQRDCYMTTLVEQQIQNTVLINADLARRCVWVQTGSWPPKAPASVDGDGADAVASEQLRRLGNVHAELRQQLAERNVVRIPPTVQVPAGQMRGVLAGLLRTLLDGVCEEHEQRCSVPRCTFGVDMNLLREIEAVNQYAAFLEQNCVNFDIMERIKSYVTNPSAEPLVVYGKSGCGKSVLSAKVAQNIHTWLPSCSFIVRFANLTPLSADIVSIVGSITEQVCYLTRATTCVGPHTIEFYANTIRDCLVDSVQPLCILIDSIDAAPSATATSASLDWLPLALPANVKIILTISDNTEQLAWLRQHLSSADSCVRLAAFSPEHWSQLLAPSPATGATSATAAPSVAEWQRSADKMPLQAKLYLWMAWLGEFCTSGEHTLDAVCRRVFDILERRFSAGAVSLAVSLLISSRYGLMESELLQLLMQPSPAESDADPDASGGWSPARWRRFCWTMGALLVHTDRVRLVDRKLQQVAAERYAAALPSAHRRLHDFYAMQPDCLTSVALGAADGQTGGAGGGNQPAPRSTANYAKYAELPFHAFRLDAEGFARSRFVRDLVWLNDKLASNGSVQLLSDVCLVPDASQTGATRLLQRFLVLNARALNYDALQFWSLLPAYVREQCAIADAGHLGQDDTVICWLAWFERIPVPWFETLGNVELLNAGRRKGSTISALQGGGDEQAESEASRRSTEGYDAVINLGGAGDFVASLSVAREEICVWDVARSVRVRQLRGIAQPTALCPVGAERAAAVLCKREIKVIDLDACAYKVTLKGVMNQKMPYFGQHDAQHLVCLSRNRMYVNLMNLESGDCVTTFKAGEDRFLNSLLVSGDGRILVCGDETQKPFPLLVWHLTQRKLLYDLRIPHHDFCTQLSAITHEGAYVAVVAQELNEPTPNFIVVYDLQSGTLFKKWKPSCNTVALAISQRQTCVLAGLEDARILMWDLVTGNCKYTMCGHSAPVTQLKLDPTGRVLLSVDAEGRDRSVRVWELSSGNTLAVYTPIEKITTCEILPGGRFIVLAVQNHPHLVTLKLHAPWIEAVAGGDAVAPEEANNDAEVIYYGQAENEGKVVKL